MAMDDEVVVMSPLIVMPPALRSIKMAPAAEILPFMMMVYGI